MFLIVDIEQPVLDDLASKTGFPFSKKFVKERLKNGASKYSMIISSAVFDLRYSLNKRL